MDYRLFILQVMAEKTFSFNYWLYLPELSDLLLNNMVKLENWKEGRRFTDDRILSGYRGMLRILGWVNRHILEADSMINYP